MTYNVKAQRAQLSTLIDLKAKRVDLNNWLPKELSELPDIPNTSTTVGSHLIYWIGVDHFIIRSSINNETQLVNQINVSGAPDTISAVLISDTLSFFELTGPQAQQIISIASPLDVHPHAFPDNGVSYTEAFGLKVLLARTQNGFEMAIDCSFKDMLEDYLTRAGVSFD